MWLAIQFPEGMVAVWHWELTNGAGSTPTAVSLRPTEATHRRDRFRHDLTGSTATAGPFPTIATASHVVGLAGHVTLGARRRSRDRIEAEGRWAQRYGPVGGGLNEMRVRSADGSQGTAIYEITGAHHHHYFPVARADGLPPDG